MNTFDLHTPIFPEAMLDAAKTYLDLLEKWNAVHSITGLAPDARFEALLLDSAALLSHLVDLPPGALVADFGSGMGVPAIVLAAYRPDLRVAAIDRSRKKSAFVRQAALELGLGNLNAVCGSVESIQPLGAQLGTAKAVGSLEILLGWWKRHSAPGAPFFAFRGSKWSADSVGGEWGCDIFPYRLPTMGERAILKLFRTG